ncbi:hypothetical protein AVEN_171982-1 [Araneus ventricosus]|uniref:Zinc finger PHD-type domain-containing protein n=1 Tax=Araneus ventricosus TaxID=182803 RepID=A0A4Y2Q415_ARAVE|nr:hypothetical protein AVEN_171982-1 [Araneus ventricosus]
MCCPLQSYKDTLGPHWASETPTYVCWNKKRGESLEIPVVNSDDDINLDINDGDKPDSRKATCIFCDGKFSEDTRGEVWVKCVMCQMLAHLDCAGAETTSYVCDFCK